MANLLFDVDGTLTESRQEVDKYFLMELKELAYTNVMYLVTGSDYIKTVEQLGEDFLHNYVAYSFNCSGNSIWTKSTEIYSKDWKPPKEVISYLTDVLSASYWNEKTGAHFDYRPGMLNFSVLGRNANKEQRNRYKEFDEKYNEREKLVKEFNEVFAESHNLVAQIAGKTGFDIYDKNADKSQILKYFDNIAVSFFADDTAANGNDYTLHKAILNRGLEEDKVYAVDSWRTTKRILEEEYLFPYPKA